MEDKLREILEEIRPDVDFTAEKELITGHVLESFDILTIGAELEDEFDIRIRPGDYVPENFNSLEAMTALIRKRQERV